MSYAAKPQVAPETISLESHTRKLEQEMFGSVAPKTAANDVQPHAPVVAPIAGQPIVASEITLDPVRSGLPLVAYSLQGAATEFEARAKDTKSLLGMFCMSGQATMLYAAPNVGKTLITLHLALDAIASERIAAGNLFYINADDSSSGLAVKLRLFDDVGAHTLVPGFKGFKAVDLIGLLRRTAQQDVARGTCIIIDTLKKFTQLMDKKLSSEFAEACRQYVMRGGTVVALAHTTKNPNSDGSPRYAGTTDFVEDFDAAYTITPLTAQADAGEKVVQFDMLKRRADSPEVVAYAYANEAGISYEERLASVRPVDLDQLDAFRRVSQRVDDAAVVADIKRRIGEGNGGGKMTLAKATAKACGVSERTAIAILERYTGSDHHQHLWTFRSGDRGVRLYELLTPD